MALEQQYHATAGGADADRPRTPKTPSRTHSAASLNNAGAAAAGGPSSVLSRESSFQGSPRQLNGQRPVSAASYSSSNRSSDLDSVGGLTGRPVRAPSAAFKIAADGQNLEEVRARVAAAKAKKAKSGGGASHRSRGVAFVDLMGGGDDWPDTDSKRVAAQAAAGIQLPSSSSSSSSLMPPRSRVARVYSDDDDDDDSGDDYQRRWKAGKSIVHRDIVKRVHDVAGLGPGDATCVVDLDDDAKAGIVEDRDDNSDDDDSDDDDGGHGGAASAGCTVVAHAERVRLMSASTSRTKSCNSRPFTAGALGRAVAAAHASPPPSHPAAAAAAGAGIDAVVSPAHVSEDVDP